MPSTTVQGTFDVVMHPDPPYEAHQGVTLSRITFDKTFHGSLAATSRVTMLAARTPVADSAGYVAVERIDGNLEGRHGSFVVLHLGTLRRGQDALSLTIVPDSGTDALVGISGEMRIERRGQQHIYALSYTLDEPAEPSGGA